jgi:hypothetical protein
MSTSFGRLSGTNESESVENIAPLFVAAYTEIGLARGVFSIIQDRIRYLMAFSAMDDPYSQTLHVKNNRDSTALIRLWPGDPDHEVAEVISTDFSYERKNQRAIQSENFLVGLGQGPVRILTQRSKGFWMDGLPPLITGPGSLLWNDGDRTVIEAGSEGLTYPPDVELDLDTLLAARSDIDKLWNIIDSLGSGTQASNFQFQNYP